MSATTTPRTAPEDAPFHAVRPRLYAIAHRVLGSDGEADDVIQDAWLRWQRTDRDQVRDPAAFLATTTTRLAINVIQSARARHETPLGPRLAEPVAAGADPALDVERQDALELALHELLHKLPPPERAVYVLREAFDYPYRDVAEVLSIGEANARQLLARARRRLAGAHRGPIDLADEQRLVETFVAAARSGDLGPLERLLAADMGHPVLQTAA
jgi:RNA polymerase sigma-70 factor (ECF subfamily)